MQKLYFIPVVLEVNVFSMKHTHTIYLSIYIYIYKEREGGEGQRVSQKELANTYLKEQTEYIQNQIDD